MPDLDRVPQLARVPDLDRVPQLARMPDLDRGPPLDRVPQLDLAPWLGPAPCLGRAPWLGGARMLSPSAGWGLASAATWGAGDFAGGLAVKRANAYVIVVAAHLLGLILTTTLALALGEAMPGPRGWWLGAIAGIAGAIGLGALYTALAIERMGVAAPITAVLSAALPVLYASLTRGAPSAVKFIGFAVALAGIWLLARTPGTARVSTGVGLALLSGTGFGFLLILMGEASSEGTLWPLAAARAASVTFMLAVAIGRRASWTTLSSVLPLALIAGFLDTAGNATFILAAKTGRLDVAAVLASLYPATTVILARFVLHERLSRPQTFGMVVTLVAIPLIAGPW